MAPLAIKFTLVLLLCTLLHRVDAQPFGGCACVKKQLTGNCPSICACLAAQGQVPHAKDCEPVCNACEAEFKSKPCGPDDKLPISCLRPASYGAAVQKCDAVKNKQCDPPGGAKTTTEKAPAGRRLFF